MDLLKLLQNMDARLKKLESQRPISRITFDALSSAPATPDTGQIVLYFKTNGKLYFKKSDGTEKEVVTV